MGPFSYRQCPPTVYTVGGAVAGPRCYPRAPSRRPLRALTAEFSAAMAEIFERATTPDAGLISDPVGDEWHRDKGRIHPGGGRPGDRRRIPEGWSQRSQSKSRYRSLSRRHCRFLRFRIDAAGASPLVWEIRTAWPETRCIPTFPVSLSRAPRVHSGAVRESEDEPPNQRVMMTRLLVVDGHEPSVRALQAILEHSGFEVITASNGAHALAIARERPPNIIVSNVLMPVMDGFALCRECKLDQQLKHIPFLFLTTSPVSPADRQFALSLGAEQVLNEPMDSGRLVSVLRELADRHQAGWPVGSRKLVGD